MKITSARGDVLAKLRRLFRPRDLFLHDGATMRRIHISPRVQALGATAASLAAGLSLLGTAQIAGAAPVVTAVLARDAVVAQMESRVAAMQSQMASIKAEATVHAARLDQRQAFLDAALSGKAAPALPAALPPATAAAAPIVAPLAAAASHQAVLAAKLAANVDARYRATAMMLRRLGVDAGRIQPAQIRPAMGGPYEPVTAASAQPDPNFRALFQSWKRLDALQQGIVAIPSQRPVNIVTFTSGFGVRSDPFRGTAAMHAGVDMPGPIGTAIYATADGVVSRAGWANGYGNLVELDHGRGIQTRYGHLSAILVQPGQRVRRGQQIARMGSTGRSTGSHLHYEVRLDGHAVNPMPFLQTANYLSPMKPATTVVAMGGPVAGD